MVILASLQTYQWVLLGVVVVLGGAMVLRRMVRRVRRRFRPPHLHPKLQMYGGLSPAERDAEYQAAQNIIATSSTGALAGYQIVQQIEAVFVEGRRSPQDALLGLKAAAGRLGANAIINLSHQRTTAGRCTAQGDAVQVRPRTQPSGEPKLERPFDGEGEE